jgi:hypothetical protein
MFTLNKFSLIITTRCNLRCKLCCEYVPQNKPFPDMTPGEAERILAAAFDVCDHITTLHLTGGGEPFLHPQLPMLIDVAMGYAAKIDRLMLFSNSTVAVKTELLDAIARHKDKIVVQLSQYGINFEHERAVAKLLTDGGINCKIEKYYGEDQPFGGWVDFGEWIPYNRTSDEHSSVFQNCAVTRDMKGNWRTRDGKVHWCSRSQRGMELGLIPDESDDYVDLFDGTNVLEKRDKFKRIVMARYISACDCCSGIQGTNDMSLRHKAAEQMEAK